TRCSPPIEKEIGFERTAPPTWNRQRGSPVDASSAKTCPSFVPPKTRPPAVDSTPDHGGECKRNSQRSLPLSDSRARIAPYALSPVSACSPPAMKGSPALYSASPLK